MSFKSLLLFYVEESTTEFKNTSLEFVGKFPRMNIMRKIQAFFEMECEF